MNEPNRRLEIGQEIETTIVAITGDTIFIDLNTKSEGVLDSAELLDADGKLTVKEGDKIRVFFVGLQNGEMRFTTKLKGDKIDQNLLENAWKSGIPVEGKVEKEIKGGYEIKIGSARAFCPFSQMGYKQKEASDAYVGKNLTFLIQEYKENGRNILVSNRAIGEIEHQNKLDDLQKNLTVGMTVTGTVTQVQDYGAFVDIGGFQALLPVSEIALTRVTDIHQLIKTGQEVEATVIKTDWKNERVSLSLKAALADPWETAAKKYPLESKHIGTIARIAEFGVFVSLEPGLDGLVHISEMDESKKNSNLRKIFKVGDTMSVLIKSVDPAQKRLSLKPSSTSEQDKTTQNYLDKQDDSGIDTYNPFAALLKKK